MEPQAGRAEDDTPEARLDAPIERRDPASGIPRANDEVPDSFSRVGYLISRGHVRVDDFWSDSRAVVAFYWGVLALCIEQERMTSGDLGIGRWFEWLELEMRRIDQRRLGRSRTFDPATRVSAVAGRIAVLRARLDRERELWAGDSVAHEPAAASQRTAADAEDVAQSH